MAIFLSILILVCACLTIYASLTDHRTLQYIAKPLTTALILVMALTLPAANAPTYRQYIAVGLVFSLLGDILLMLPKNMFIYGIVSFLLTHLCYTAAFTQGTELHIQWLLPLLLIPAMVSFFIWSRLGKLRVPVLIYELVIITMVWRALAQLETLGTQSALLAVYGALFFLLSDTMLAIDRFGKHFRLAPLLVLGTYYLAQWLIAMSV
ncbi:MAG: lysoplasmalogenase [Chloroflexi bacterium]|nr:lysoplasmalogenase [Chloroflexota bacterium]